MDFFANVSNFSDANDPLNLSIKVVSIDDDH